MASPACDLDAERALLGSLLVYGDHAYVDGVSAQGLLPEHFYLPQHEATFQAMLKLAAARGKIDPITVAAELKRADAPSPDLLDRERLDLLAGHLPAAGHLTEYVLIVREKAQWRAIQRTARHVLAAAEKCNSKRYTEALSTLSLAPERRPTDQPQALPSRLRLVQNSVRHIDANGEVLDHCPSCKELEAELAKTVDLLKGARSDVKKWTLKHYELEREFYAEERAIANEWYAKAEALYEVWQEKTGHQRTKWAIKKFYEALPYLSAYGMEGFERAIEGVAYDPFVTVRKNGTRQVHNSWGLLTKNFKTFEEFMKRPPKDWKPTLSEQIVRTTQLKPSLRVVQERPA